jgi:hypothetical protein
VTTPPEDEHLPARLRANDAIREGERQIGRAWFRALTRWLDRARPDVVHDDTISPQNVAQHSAFWGQLVESDIVPVAGSVLARIYRSITSRDPLTDPAVADYLNQAGNRLRGVPDAVYSLIVRDVETGIHEGESIPDIAARVQSTMTATGTDYWPNRAVTVARTETMAAVNGGAFFGAHQEAEQRGDPAPFKMWLATEDSRTRPTHVEADQQRTLLSEPFRVGASRLQYPGDPHGAAAEVINCRCVMIPIVLGETLDWTDRQRP